MADRLDLSSFKPSGNEKRVLGEEIERCVDHLGGRLWDPLPHSSPEAREKALAQTFRLEEHARAALGPGRNRTIAIVDWSALHRTCELLTGNEVEDPFIALADLSSVLGACLFYDKVIVMEGGDLHERASRALGLDDVFTPISPSASEFSMARLLDHHYSWAFHRLNDATHQGERWIGLLEEFWTELLPGTSFPRHDARAFDVQLGYTTSPQRQSWRDVVFRSGAEAWYVSPHDPQTLILDNDIRALVYARLAQTLDSMLADSENSVRYTGGCLRSPMLLARAKYADMCLQAAPSVEEWLHGQWRMKYRSVDCKVRLPFWVGAILARCRGTRSAIPEEVARCREQAAQLRKRKAELETALRDSREGELKELADAVKGDTDELTKWVDDAVGVVSAGAAVIAEGVLKTHAPLVPTEIVKPAEEAAVMMGGAGWLKKLALRLFRPHIYFVSTLASDAEVLRDSVVAAARLFGLGGKVASEPLDFLTRLGRAH